MTFVPERVVRVGNLSDISVAYGQEVARRILAEVARRLEYALGALFSVTEIDDLGLAVRSTGFAGGRDQWMELEAALHAAAASPIAIGNARIVVALSSRSELSEEVDAQRTSASLSPIRYRTDMSAAALAYSALAKGRLFFVEQTICHAEDRSEILYSERLARLRGEDGGLIMPGIFVPALERLGLTVSFDRHVVQATIDSLIQRPDAILGCNISARSVSTDTWWHTVFPRLVGGRDLASRLVIEITETSQFPSLEKAAELVRAIRETGCRVALDDFGAGFSSIGFARDADFDIIKIDASYVRNHASGVGGVSLLQHLVALAQQVAGEAVVEGIETSDGFAHARNAGAKWLQGYFVGYPEPTSNSTARAFLEHGYLHRGAEQTLGERS